MEVMTATRPDAIQVKEMYSGYKKVSDELLAEIADHHSAAFPKVMGLMLGMTPLSENHMMNFDAEHAAFVDWYYGISCL